MSNSYPIENDSFYKRISQLSVTIGLNPAERVVFLSSFESWYHFQPYSVYTSICTAAISALEELSHEKC
ncbi:hypothetical protein M3891_003441 [Vibrio metschnikovii]|nr:hypothetical protein [Vibrio metschnikovii]